MSRLPRVNGFEVMAALRRDGWQVARQSGSHAVLVHATKPGNVPVPLHRRDLPTGTLRSIIRLAGLSVAEFNALL
jgi:predicted RNA binding protein YcfA (HicA-like mRNA interferase family)